MWEDSRRAVGQVDRRQKRGEHTGPTHSPRLELGATSRAAYVLAPWLERSEMEEGMEEEEGGRRRRDGGGGGRFGLRYEGGG